MATNCIGQIEHPAHGVYYIHFSDGCYGLTKNEKEIIVWCAYASLAALFKAKDL